MSEVLDVEADTPSPPKPSTEVEPHADKADSSGRAKSDTEGRKDQSLKDLIAAWGTYGAIGSAVLYLCGYLSLRFHLTVLGVATDLQVLDERYVLDGAKFLVYLVPTVSSVAVALFFAGVILFSIWRLIGIGRRNPLAVRTPPRSGRSNEGSSGGGDSTPLPGTPTPSAVRPTAPSRPRRRVRIRRSRGRPLVSASEKQRTVPLPVRTVLLIVCILLSYRISLEMREIFDLTNLLVGPDQPPSSWLGKLLLDEQGQRYYFFIVVLGCCVTAGLLIVAVAQGPTPYWWIRSLEALAALQVATQILLLPVNYGVLIKDKLVPRVLRLGEKDELEKGQKAWLVWEGKDAFTYLVHTVEEPRSTAVPTQGATAKPSRPTRAAGAPRRAGALGRQKRATQPSRRRGRTRSRFRRAPAAKRAVTARRPTITKAREVPMGSRTKEVVPWKLVTLRKADVGRIDILCYESVFDVRFRSVTPGCESHQW